MSRKRSSITRKGKGNLSRIALQLPQVANKVTQEFADEVVRIAKKKLIGSGKSSSGLLLNSFKVEAVAVNQFASRWRVSNNAPYAIFVEFGRRPGNTRPPLQPILDWIGEKGIVPYNQQAVTTDEQLAYLIAGEIAAEGIEPVLFFTSIVNDREAKLILRNNFSLAFRKAVSRNSVRRG